MYLNQVYHLNSMDELYSSENYSDFINFNLNPSDYNVTDLYEVYRFYEMERLRTYKYVGFILGTIIILSNLPIVVSSGLILRKGKNKLGRYCN